MEAILRELFGDPAKEIIEYVYYNDEQTHKQNMKAVLKEIDEITWDVHEDNDIDEVIAGKADYSKMYYRFDKDKPRLCIVAEFTHKQKYLVNEDHYFHKINMSNSLEGIKYWGFMSRVMRIDAFKHRDMLSKKFRMLVEIIYGN